MALFALLLVAVQTPDTGLAGRIAARIAAAPATAVGVYYRDLTTRDSTLVNARLRFHAASTMKVPVMIQLFRDRDAHRLSLDDSIFVTNTFKSIVDSSPYQLDKADDSDSSLYARVGGKASIRELVELMETVSSNLATNLLIARVGRSPDFFGVWLPGFLLTGVGPARGGGRSCRRSLAPRSGDGPRPPARAAARGRSPVGAAGRRRARSGARASIATPGPSRFR